MYKRVLFVFVVLISIASFAETKIRVIDMQQVYRKYNRTIEINKALSDKGKEIESYMKEQYEKPLKQLQGQLQKLQETASSIALNQDSRNKAAFQASKIKDKFQVLQKEAINYRKMKSQELTLKMKKLRDQLVVEITKIIKAYGKENNITLILDQTGKTGTGLPAVVYSNDAINITTIILEKLNK